MPNYDTEDLVAFAVIYEAGGISQAERASGRSKASLSRALARLETAADCHLFERLSIGMKPTRPGKLLFAIANDIRLAAAEADGVLRGAADGPQGRLTVAASATASQLLLGPVLAAFKVQHPQVEVALHATTAAPDPKGSDIDLVLRAGWPTEQHLLARRVLSGETGLYSHSSAQAPQADGEGAYRINRIVIDASDAPAEWCKAWVMSCGDRTMVLDEPPYMRIAEPSVVLSTMANGQGVALLPHFYARQYLKSGALCRILPEWSGPPLTLYAALPEGRTKVPAVRAFLDLLIDYAGRMAVADSEAATST